MFAGVLPRISRLYKNTIDLYNRAGLLHTAIYISRYLAAKAPLLAGHIVQRRRLAPVTRKIAQRRAHDESLSCPLLAFKVTGGVGDYIVVARFLRDLKRSCENFVFDVYASVPVNALWIFRAVEGCGEVWADILFDHVYQAYDASFSIGHFVAVCSYRTRGILRKCPHLAQTIAKIQAYRRYIDVHIAQHPKLDNALGRIAIFSNASRRDYMHRIAGIEYGGDQMPLPSAVGAQKKFELHEHPYITIHNGFDPGFVISGKRATKCYPHFSKVAALIKKELPNLLIVQVGTTTSDPIQNTDLNLIGRTELSEVAAILKDALLHLDSEGGLVHMARCYGVPSCVVFGPTPSAYFGYPTNINIDPPVCGDCWWITSSWMSICPRGYEHPRCLVEQEPENVAAAAISYLKQLRPDLLRSPKMPG